MPHVLLEGGRTFLNARDVCKAFLEERLIEGLLPEEYAEEDAH